MTRREQLIINDYCERELPYVAAELGNVLSVRRLHLSQAYVYETNSYYVLKSFTAFVAFIRKSDYECFDILRKCYGYPSNSLHHIAKFKTEYRSISTQTWREV